MIMAPPDAYGRFDLNHKSLQASGQPKSPESGNAHYAVDSELNLCESGILPRHFTAWKPLPHEWLCIMRIADHKAEILIIQWA
jgi:hypothetical protein